VAAPYLQHPHSKRDPNKIARPGCDGAAKSKKWIAEAIDEEAARFAEGRGGEERGETAKTEIRTANIKKIKLEGESTECFAVQ